MILWDKDFYDIFPEKTLRNFRDKVVAVLEQIDEWDRECSRIKESCKAFNESLMAKIVANEKIINGNPYEEVNKIKNQIDSFSNELKLLFKNHEKYSNLISDPKEDFLIFFESSAKKNARACSESNWSKISACFDRLRQLFRRLFEHTGGYKCVISIARDWDLYLVMSQIFSDNERLSEAISQVSCTSKSSRYKWSPQSCRDARLETPSWDSCYVKPTIQHKKSPLRSQLKEVALPKRPNSKIVLRKGNFSKTIDLFDDGLHIYDIQQAIERKQKERDGEDTVKALASAHLNKTRTLAGRIKKGLQSQIEILGYCPYCEKTFDDDIPHADHIYPVSMGGLSTPANMVYICSKCNSRKANKTLREFIRESNLDRNRIERNLEFLKKTF